MDNKKKKKEKTTHIYAAYKRPTSHRKIHKVKGWEKTIHANGN